MAEAGRDGFLEALHKVDPYIDAYYQDVVGEDDANIYMQSILERP
jgi:hypothetical protein